jgi:hypothetical protein
MKSCPLAKATQTSEPVFVIGNPRSGTTLFRLMLTSHSKIGIPPETSFIVRLFGNYGHIRQFDEKDLARLKLDFESDSIDIESYWKVSISDLFARDSEFLGLSYSQICEKIYRNFHLVRGLGNPEIWGDKNNAYGNYIEILNHVFPSAKFIHIVRDGRAVFNSYKNLNQNDKHRYAPKLPRDARSVALRWVDMVLRIDRHLKRLAPDRHIVVRYEHLLADFRPTMETVSGFLGVSYESAMAQFAQFNELHELEPKEYGWKENTFKPIDTGKIDLWKAELDPLEIREFESISAAVLTKHGYSLMTEPSALRAFNSFSLALIKGRVKEYIRTLRFSASVARAKIGF